MKKAILVLLCFLGLKGVSQNTVFEAGLAPEISLSYKLSDKIKFNVKVESFHAGFQTADSESPSWAYEYDVTESQFYTSWKINPFQSAAIGYQWAIGKSGKSNHSSIQQYSFVHRPGNLLFAHRLRADQTFYRDESPRYRFRYRLSIEIPLQGQTIDPGEFYLVTSEEVIYGFQGKEGVFQNRLAAFAGHYFRNNDKIQIGLEHRVAARRNATVHELWIKVGWFINLSRG